MIAATVASMARSVFFEDDQSAGTALYLHVSGPQHGIPVSLASSHIATSSTITLVHRFRFRVQPSDFVALVLKHLVELLSTCLSIFVILMDQDWPHDQLIEALQIVRALVLLGLLIVISSFIPIFVSR